MNYPARFLLPALKYGIRGLKPPYPAEPITSSADTFYKQDRGLVADFGAD